MNSNDFWCRAFLEAMNTSRAGLDACEREANAALAVAQRRGMVTVSEAPGPAAAPEPDVLGWLAAQESDQGSGPRFGVWRPSRGAYQERRFYARRVEWTSAGLCLVGDEGGQELAFAVLHIMRDWTMVEAPGPKLERVEFTAEPRGARGSGLRALRTASYPEGLIVVTGDESFTLHDGNRVRIKWGESSPPKPIEVWIERGG